MGSSHRQQMKEYIMDVLEKHVKLVKADNAVYSDSQAFLVLSWAGINQLSIREAAEQLKGCGYDVPSGDALLERLSKQPYEVLEAGFDAVLAELLDRARQQQLFTHPVIVAIDFTDIEWYGEELPFIVKSQSKNGTNRFIRFATIAVVEDGKRFTLKVLPVTPLSNTADVVEELIRYARQLVDIRVALFDRGFYSNAVIETMKDLGERFVMPAVKNDKVTATMEQAYQDGSLTYEMSAGATYTMVVARDDENDRLLPYATNMDSDAATVHELYGHRFGIETQYRVKNRFLGRTCSKQYSVRYAFFVLAVTLYNIWVLLNIVERGKDGLNPGKIPIKVDRLKHIYRLVIYQRAPG
jgi:hypothetical protein